MGASFSFDNNDAESNMQMLEFDVTSHKFRNFERILKNQTQRLPIRYNNIYQLIICYSPSFTHKLMEKICLQIIQYRHILPKINDYKYNFLSSDCFCDSHCIFTLNSETNDVRVQPASKYAMNKKYDHINKEGKVIETTINTNIITTQTNRPHVFIRLDYDNINLAYVIKEHVFKKFNLDLKIIDKLIDTLKYINNAPCRTIKQITQQNSRHLIDKYIMYDVITSIKQINLLDTENIFHKYENYIYEADGITIWHHLVIACLSYTELDDIIELTNFITSNCSKSNINKCASTNNVINIIEGPTITFLLGTKIDEDEFFSWNEIQINKLRPITLALKLQHFSHFYERKKAECIYNIKPEIINYVIDKLNELNSEIISHEDI